ncbi:hypothetical protein ACOMHN_000307 [Nucella lapillus]
MDPSHHPYSHAPGPARILEKLVLENMGLQKGQQTWANTGHDDPFRKLLSVRLVVFFGNALQYSLAFTIPSRSPSQSPTSSVVQSNEHPSPLFFTDSFLPYLVKPSLSYKLPFSSLSLSC